MVQMVVFKLASQTQVELFWIWRAAQSWWARHLFMPFKVFISSNTLVLDELLWLNIEV